MGLSRNTGLGTPLLSRFDVDDLLLWFVLPGVADWLLQMVWAEAIAMGA
jgi:hypothetical protein